MPDKSTLTLPEAFDVTQIENVRNRALKALEKDITGFRIKADKVAKVDSAGIQLLLSLNAHTEKHGMTLEIERPSESLIQGATMLGAAELLSINE